MEKLYKKIGWKNKPNLSTPLGARNLGKMDDALEGLDNRVIELDTQRGNDKQLIDRLSAETDALEKEIEEVRTETNSSIDALKIVPTASGYPVYIFDASNMGFEGIDFFGESKQMQTTGKNELQNTAVTRTDAGLTYTVNSDGSVAVNGTATGLSIVKVGNFKNTDRNLILSGCPSGGSNSTYKLSYYNESTQVNDFGSGVTLPKNDLTYEVRIVIYGGTTINNLTFKPMIRLASITDATYEPYTGGKASPSPDYPQPIESKIVNRVDVSNAQLLDLIANTNQATTNGMVISVESGYILTVNGTSSKAWSNLTEFAELSIPSGKYTFSVDSVPSGLNGIGIKFRKSIEDSTNVTHVITGSKKSVTLDYSNEFKLVQIYADGCDTSTNYNFTIKVMLNAGETALPFEQHQSQTVNLSEPIELNGIGDVKDYIDTERGVIVRKLKGKHFLKSDMFKFTQATNGNYIATNVLDGGKVFGKCICTHFLGIDTADRIKLAHLFRCYVEADARLYFRDTAESLLFTNATNTLAVFENNDVYAWYELETPEETALPQADIDALKNLHTYKPNTVVMNDADALMDVHYVADAKTYIDKKFEALASAIVNQ